MENYRINSLYAILNCMAYSLHIEPNTLIQGKRVMVVHLNEDGDEVNVFMFSYGQIAHMENMWECV